MRIIGLEPTKSAWKADVISISPNSLFTSLFSLFCQPPFLSHQIHVFLDFLPFSLLNFLLSTRFFFLLSIRFFFCFFFFDQPLFFVTKSMSFWTFYLSLSSTFFFLFVFSFLTNLLFFVTKPMSFWTFYLSLPLIFPLSLEFSFFFDQPPFLCHQIHVFLDFLPFSSLKFILFHSTCFSFFTNPLFFVTKSMSFWTFYLSLPSTFYPSLEFSLFFLLFCQPLFFVTKSMFF